MELSEWSIENADSFLLDNSRGSHTMQMKFPSSNFYFFIIFFLLYLNFIKHLVQVNYSVLRLITNSTGTRVEPAQIISPTFVIRTSRNCEGTVAIVNFLPPPPQVHCHSEHRNFYLSYQSSVLSHLPTFHSRETHF